MSDHEVRFLQVCMLSQHDDSTAGMHCMGHAPKNAHAALSPFHHIFRSNCICFELSAKEKFAPTGIFLKRCLEVVHLTVGQPSILPGFSSHSRQKVMSFLLFHLIGVKELSRVCHLTGVKELLEMLQGSQHPLALFFTSLVQAALHVLLMPLVDRGLPTGQEALPQDDIRTVVLDQQPHDPAT